jgi:prolyl oligopeptidase
MLLRTALFVILPFLAIAAAPAKRPTKAPPGAARSAAAAKELAKFFDEEWEYGLREYPERATYLGDPRYNDRLTDLSFEAIERRNKHEQEALARLKKVDPGLLSESDRLSFDLYARRLEIAIEGQRFATELMPINQQDGLHKDFAILSTVTTFRTAKDYRDYLSRLSAFPRQVDQTIALMERGREKGWIHPAVPLREVGDAIRAQISPDPEKSVHFKPFEKFPEGVLEPDREALRIEGRRRIANDVFPAYLKLYTYFTRDYLPAAKKEVGAWALPDGEAYYAYAIRQHTTTNRTAKEIHDTGLAEVARIRRQMEDIVKSVRFKGNFDAFLKFLRTDPRFYYKTASDLLEGYRDICKRVDPELIRLFGTLPRTPYGVIPTPDFEAPTSTTAYYRQGSAEARRPGYFVANTFKLETRPKYEMEALAIHEAVPGHHLQISLAQELTGLPQFRRHGGYTAFIEGWGLYAESLGDEMGFYTDPYSKFGQLTYEMWRAVRLVVDTGMHAFKWERQRAIDFMKANTAKTEHDITVEIDRYIVWPGQALAYKTGELKLKELRARAKTELGQKFDIRAFHDAVLLAGALPLDVLEKRVDDWVAREKAPTSRSVTPTSR